MNETDRLQFIINRAPNKQTGIQEAIEFAKRGIAIYTEEALCKNFKLKGAIETYKKFLEDQGYTVSFLPIVIRN